MKKAIKTIARNLAIFFWSIERSMTKQEKLDDEELDKTIAELIED